MKNKLKNIINILLFDLQERDEAIKLSLLAMLSGESIFLMGPPGVAKSLVSRKMKEAIKDARNFEYLMNRFSTPDEIFGPISLSQLDNDIYERKIEGFLPSVEIAFLDEIWKASPSIQNTLLTIINEKIYQNGNQLINVPLQLLIAASNELPIEGEGLEALYDRFIIRLFVDNVANKENFWKVIDNTKTLSIKLDNKEKITLEDINLIKEKSKNIELDENTFNYICDLKDKLNVELAQAAPYISDRRWKKISNILKTSAFCSGRNTIEPIDWLLIDYMIWENADQIKSIKKIISKLWIDHVLLKNKEISIEEIENKLNYLINEFDKAYINQDIPRKYIKEEKIVSSTFKKPQYQFKDSENDSSQHYLYEIEGKKDYFYFLNINESFQNGNNIKYFYQYKDRFSINSKSFSYYSSNKLTINSIISEDIFIDNESNKWIRQNKKVKKIDIEKIQNIKSQLAILGKELAKLDYQKENIINKLKSFENIFVNNYELTIKEFDNYFDSKINEISLKRDELISKIGNTSEIEVNKTSSKNDKKNKEINISI